MGGEAGACDYPACPADRAPVVSDKVRTVTPVDVLCKASPLFPLILRLHITHTITMLRSAARAAKPTASALRQRALPQVAAR